MPYSYRVDSHLRCIFVVLSGIVTETEAEELLHAIWKHPDFDQSYCRLVDGRPLEKLLVRVDKVRGVAAGGTARQSSRVALVAASDAIYGVFRMYEAYLGAENSAVFRDYEEACRWLGLADEETAAEFSSRE